MIDELFDPISKISPPKLFVNDIEVDSRVLNDKLISIELNFNAFNPIPFGLIVCAEEIFTLSIGKRPSELTYNDTIKIVFCDNAGDFFERRYAVIKACRDENNNYHDSEYWTISINEFYANFLDMESGCKYITQKGYRGIPTAIVRDALSDLFAYPKEIANYYGDQPLNIVIENNVIDFIDNYPEIEYRFPKDASPLNTIKKFCELYNILVYQDYNSIKIIHNPIISNLEKPTEIIYRESAGTKNYCHKICDRIKQHDSVDTINRPNYRISLNEGGKKQRIKKIDFDMLAGTIELNGHFQPDFENQKEIYMPSSSYNLSSLMMELTQRYIKSNNLIIYVRPILAYSNVGSITTVQLDYQSNFPTRRQSGDLEFSGFWFIRNTTLKITNGHLIARLMLCRFDNPSDYADTCGNAVVGEGSKNEKYVLPVYEHSEFAETNSLNNEIINDISNIQATKPKTVADKKNMREKLLESKR